MSPVSFGRRALLFLALFFVFAAAVCYGGYRLNLYWIHRYDALISRRAEIYHVDPDLVWSVIYEETYFRPWKTGSKGEIGLMQITPAVGREWAGETGFRDVERQMASDPAAALRNPERNIEIGCWYLEKIAEDYRGLPGAEARVIAAYNAGPSRAAEWNQSRLGRPLTTDEFISRIDIPSTRAYVTSIINRYRKLKAMRQSGARQVSRAASDAPDLETP